MKTLKIIISAVLVIGSTIGVIAAALGYEAYRSRDITADILARAPERGNFYPREISLPVGRKARLRVRNVDTVTHGFTIPGLGVDASAIGAGKQYIVEFTPQQTGTYDFYCTVWCSTGHLQMRGVIKVVAK